MIHFQCPHCAQKLTVPDGQAGRAGQCPKCKNPITIPPMASSASRAISEELLAAAPSPPADLARTRAPQKSQSEAVAVTSDALDRRLLDLPPTGDAEIAIGATRARREVLAKLRFTPPPEHTGRRQLPWPIDILLYPTTMAGLTSLAVIVGIPFLLTVLQRLVFLPFLGLPLLIVKLVVALYGLWYSAECTYDSARGGIRRRIFDTASLGDMWSRVSYLLAVYIIFVLPTVLYPLYGGRNAAILWHSSCLGRRLFPNGSACDGHQRWDYVLNPALSSGLDPRTLVPYLGLLLLITAQGLLFRLIPNLLMRPRPRQGGSASDR